MHERTLDQNDPDLDTMAELQHSITATMGYLLGRCSLPELFGLQAYLSKLASQLAHPTSQGQIAAQMREMARQQQMREMANQVAQQQVYQQES
jgi:hypothetical protein